MPKLIYLLYIIIIMVGEKMVEKSVDMHFFVKGCEL